MNYIISNILKFIIGIFQEKKHVYGYMIHSTSQLIYVINKSKLTEEEIEIKKNDIINKLKLNDHIDELIIEVCYIGKKNIKEIERII